MRKDLELLDTAHPYTPMPDEMIGPFKHPKTKTSCSKEKERWDSTNKNLFYCKLTNQKSWKVTRMQDLIIYMHSMMV